MSDLRNDVDTNAMASVDDWAAEQTPWISVVELGKYLATRTAPCPEALRHHASPIPPAVRTCGQIRRPGDRLPSRARAPLPDRSMMTSQVVRALIRLRYVERTRDRRDKRAFAFVSPLKDAKSSSAPNLIYGGSARFFAPSSTRHTGLYRRITALGGCTPAPPGTSDVPKRLIDRERSKNSRISATASANPTRLISTPSGNAPPRRTASSDRA